MGINQAGALIPEEAGCLCGQGTAPAPTLLIFKYPSLRGSLPKEIPPSCSFLPHDETKAQNKLNVLKLSCINRRKLACVQSFKCEPDVNPAMVHPFQSQGLREQGLTQPCLPYPAPLLHTETRADHFNQQCSALRRSISTLS